MKRWLLVAVGLLGLLALSSVEEEEVPRPCRGPHSPGDTRSTTDLGQAGTLYSDIPYAGGELLDVSLPVGWQADPCVPTILYVHGGNFWRGGKADSPDLHRELVGTHGYPVVSPSYTLAEGVGKGSYPQAIRDVKAALAWIRSPRGGETYCLSPCVVVVSSSAGSLLGSMCAVTWNANDEGLFDPGFPGATRESYRPDFVITFSGISDLFDMGQNGLCPPEACTTLGCRFPFDTCGDGVPEQGYPADYPEVTSARKGPVGTRTAVELFLDCDWDGPERLVAHAPSAPLAKPTGDPFVDASPRYWLDAADPPFFAIHAQCDKTVPSTQTDPILVDALSRYPGLLVGKLTPMDCAHGLRDLYPDPAEAARLIDGLIRESWGGCCP